MVQYHDIIMFARKVMKILTLEKTRTLKIYQRQKKLRRINSGRKNIPLTKKITSVDLMTLKKKKVSVHTLGRTLCQLLEQIGLRMSFKLFLEAF